MRKYQLDGLRFVLFLMVFATHYSPKPSDVEYFGYALPVFFVMSGFLITNVLLSASDPSLTAKLRTFYVRRILRICPAYYLVVALLIALGLLSYPFHYLVYLINIKLFSLSLSQESAAFQQWFVQNWQRESMHLWSLSVEEQFYIVYPLVLYLTPARWRTTMLFLLLFASIAARLWFLRYFPKSYYGTLLPVCAEYFVWGCIFSWLDHRKKLERLPPGWTLAVSTAAVLALIAIEFHLGHSGFFQFKTSNYQTPIALGMGFFVWGLWALDHSHPVARVLSWKPLVYFGTMSYTLYLVHLAAFDLFRASAIDLPFSEQTNRVVGSFFITLLMGMAIWHLAEKPLYSLRRFLPYAK